MFGVALCGIAPLEWPSAPSPVVALPDPSDESFLVAAAHAFAAMQDDFGAVLVLHAPGAGHRRRVLTARNLADSKRVLPLSLQLPHTAVAAVADLVAQLSGRDVPAGTVVGCLPRVLATMTTVARTSSVTRLSAVNVGLRSHGMSLVPGSSFLVGLSPTPFLSSCRRAPALALPTGGTRLVTAGDETYAGPVSALLGAAASGASEVLHRTDPGALAWWQARRTYEATVLPVDVSDLAASLRDRVSASCPTCGDTAVESECPFCCAMEVL